MVAGGRRTARPIASGPWRATLSPGRGLALADLARPADAPRACPRSGDAATSRTAVGGVTLDSRRVSPGDLYAALPGRARPRRDVLAAGPRRPERSRSSPTPTGAGAGRRRRAGRSSYRRCGRCSAASPPWCTASPPTRLRMIGVTGTQGKTTTTRLLESGLSGAGVPAAVIGTVGTRMLGEDVASRADDPRGARPAAAVPADGRARRRGVRDGGVQPRAGDGPRRRLRLRRRACSSTSAATTSTSIATWTTTSTPRPRCSRPSTPARGLVNVDDEWGRRLVDRADGAGRDPVGDRPRRRLAGRRRRAVGRPARRSASLGPGVDVAAGCPIPGAFNVANTLAAVAAAATAGYDAAAVARAIAGGPGVPGRLERIDEGQDFAVVVDYAHKPDAVAAALATLRPLTRGRLIVVLGAGGDRDPGKRPLMGEIAAARRRRARRHRRQPAQRGPRGDPRRDPGRDDRRHAPRCVEIGDRRAAIAEALAARRAGRRRAGRRQGPRDRPGGRRRGAPVRRPRRGRARSCAGDRADPRRDRRGRRRPRRRRRRRRRPVTGPAFVDTRAVEPGGLFVAVAGEHVDGHDFAAGGGRGRRGRRARRAADRRTDRGRRRPGPCPRARSARHVVDALRRRPCSRSPAPRARPAPRTSSRRCSPAAGDRRSGPRATATTRSASHSPCCAPPPTPASSPSRWARAASATSPSCARSRRRDVAAVLNVGTAHIGEFGSREAIAQAKGEIVEALPADGTAVLNADDDAGRRDGARARRRRVLYLRCRPATSRWRGLELDELGRPAFELGYDGTLGAGAPARGRSPPGANAAAAAAMALAAGVPLGRRRRPPRSRPLAVAVADGAARARRRARRRQRQPTTPTPPR